MVAQPSHSSGPPLSFYAMKTILLIDDEEGMRFTFGTALRDQGYHVIEADSGATGLHLARQHLPGVILTDIQMPGGDGSTLLRDIRRDPSLRATQVVLMTGKAELVPPRKGMEDGADDFLLKPFSFEDLVKCMEARFNRAAIPWRVGDQALTQLRSLVPPQLPHEFFTPMAGIIGLTEVLRSDLATLTQPEVSDIVEDIHHSALHLHRTIRNYLLILDLQIAAPETLVGALLPRQVEDCIEAGVREALRLNPRRDDITIRIEAPSLPVKATDLSRIVEELVDNACKFSRKGTPVKVEMNPAGQLTVTDQGRGLTAGDIEQIGAFQQFDRKKYEQQGLGLGLVVVQKLAALSAAKFSIQSQPGEGTEARVDFLAPV